jgi:hypothetical protein
MTLTTINLAALGDTINLTTEVTGTVPIANGGTNSTATTFVNAATNVTGTLATGNGGTGATTFAPGKILQTINVAITSEYSTTSTSFSDVTGFSLSITPSAASSKIYVGVYAQMYNNDTDTQSGASTKFLRNINGGGYTNLSAQGAGISAIVSTVDASAGSNNAHLIPFNVTLIDSPSATTVCNYKIMGAASWGGTARYCYDSISGYMWAMEIGA